MGKTGMAGILVNKLCARADVPRSVCCYVLRVASHDGTAQRPHLGGLQVEAPSFWRIFGHDAAQPFYCFQVRDRVADSVI